MQFELVYDYKKATLARGISLQPGCGVPQPVELVRKQWVTLGDNKAGPKTGDILYATVLYGNELPVTLRKYNAYGSLDATT